MCLMELSIKRTHVQAKACRKLADDDPSFSFPVKDEIELLSDGC